MSKSQTTSFFVGRFIYFVFDLFTYLLSVVSGLAHMLFPDQGCEGSRQERRFVVGWLGANDVFLQDRMKATEESFVSATTWARTAQSEFEGRRTGHSLAGNSMSAYDSSSM